MPLYEYRTYDPECGRRVLLEHAESMSSAQFTSRVANAEAHAMGEWLANEQPHMRAYEQKCLAELRQARTERLTGGVASEVAHPVYGDGLSIDVMIEYYETQAGEPTAASYGWLVDGIVLALEADGFSQVSGTTVVARPDMAIITGVGECACGQRYLQSSTKSDPKSDPESGLEGFASHSCPLSD